MFGPWVPRPEYLRKIVLFQFLKLHKTAPLCSAFFLSANDHFIPKVSPYHVPYFYYDVSSGDSVSLSHGVGFRDVETEQN